MLTKEIMTAKRIEFVEVDVTLVDNATSHACITDELGYGEAPVAVVDKEDHSLGSGRARSTASRPSFAVHAAFGALPHPTALGALWMT